MSDDMFKKRVQLDFNQSSYSRLIAMKGESKEKTLSGVIRNALYLLDWLLKYRSQGYTIQLRGPEGQVVDPPDPLRRF